MSSAKKKIWIDTDIIFNKHGEEVDDGLALMMAFNHPDIDIKGISLIHEVDNGFQAASRLRNYYSDYEIPIYKGADDARQGPGAKTEAVEAMAKALRKEKLAVLAIGPATNIANLLEFYPEAAQNITDIVFCAGRQQGVTFQTAESPVNFPDYNVEMDPESMKRVIESDLPVTLSGFEASSSVFLYRDDLGKIEKNGRDGDEWVYRQLMPWINRWDEKLHIKGFIPFDTCTAGHLFYPDYFKYHRNIPVAMHMRKNDAPVFSEVQQKSYLEASFDLDSSHTVNFAYEAKKGYKKMVMRNLLGK